MSLIAHPEAMSSKTWGQLLWKSNQLITITLEIVQLNYNYNYNYMAFEQSN